jgi:ATP synthase protein I
MTAAEAKRGKGRETFLSEVQRRRERHEEYVRDGDSSFWQSVGMMGTIGWSVSVPMVLGLFLGRLLDVRLDSAHVFMMFFMLVGLIVGCVTAWRMIAEKIWTN